MSIKTFDLNHMNTTVRPQDDFYTFVNGNWQQTATIPDDQARWGSFSELVEKTVNASLDLLNNILSETYAPDTEGFKIQTLYKLYTDLDRREQDGLKNIQTELDAIDSISTLDDLKALLIKQVKESGRNPFYNWTTYPDMVNSKINAVYLDGGPIYLPRDYYQKQSEKNTEVIQKYTEFVENALVYLGLSQEEALKSAKQIIAFEQEIAAVLLTNEDQRNVEKIYNPFITEELDSLTKNTDLPGFLKAVGVDTDQTIICELEYFKHLDNFFCEEKIELIKLVLKYDLLHHIMGISTQALFDLRFDFYDTYLQGRKTPKALNKRGLDLINNILDEAFGKVYVEHYFPASYKEKMIELITYLRKAFKSHIENLNWMSDETKEKALYKLEHFNVKIGYPDKWEDYSKLVMDPDSSLYDNILKVHQWSYQKELEKVGQPVDKAKWSMGPQVVNAYYSPLNNEIVFPAAILQPPFFYPEGDPAINFGGIGGVIGHEITHGFDDFGRKFDAQGNLSNWWTDEDSEKFSGLTQKLVEQFNTYEPVPGHFVNGVFTLGENIADLGGIAIAFDALQLYLQDKGSIDPIDGFTQEQRFFISWTTVWRSLSRTEQLINQVATDPHAPELYRATSPLMHQEAFYRAFDVKSGDKHYKDKDDRIIIW